MSFLVGTEDMEFFLLSVGPPGGVVFVFFVFMGRGARPTPFGDHVFLFCVFTGRVRQLATSGGVIVLFFDFTSRVRQLATSGGPIFRCTTKDRGERRAKGLQSRPLDSGFLYGG